MKLFRVISERDGLTIKEPGITETEIKRESMYYAAESIDAVWDEIAWIRNDPERLLIALVEDAPLVTVIDHKQKDNHDQA